MLIIHILIMSYIIVLSVTQTQINLCTSVEVGAALFHCDISESILLLIKGLIDCFYSRHFNLS